MEKKALSLKEGMNVFCLSVKQEKEYNSWRNVMVYLITHLLRKKHWIC